MPIISKVEAKSRRGRLIHLAIIVVLSLGGITMVYPFMIMVSGSFCSVMDENDLVVVPKYFNDDDVLYRKFLETNYNQGAVNLDKAHLETNFNFRTAQLPLFISDRQADDMTEFFRDTEPPTHWKILGGMSGTKAVFHHTFELQDRLYEKYDGDIDALSRDISNPINGWNMVRQTSPRWVERRYSYEPNVIFDEYEEMTNDSPIAEQRLVAISGDFLRVIAYPRYARSVYNYNKAHAGDDLGTFGDFVLPATVPGMDEPLFRMEWIEYVTKELNPSFVVVDDEMVGAYRKYLEEKYEAIESLNAVWGREGEGKFGGFGDIELPDGGWISGSESADYRAFLELSDERLNEPEDQKIKTPRYVDYFRVIGPEYAWREWLREKYETLDDLNRACSPDFVPLYERLPGENRPIMRGEWKRFVMEVADAEVVRLEDVPDEAYQAFLMNKYGDIEKLNDAWGMSNRDFSVITVPRYGKLEGQRKKDYREFYLTLPTERYRIDDSAGPAQKEWQQWLLGREDKPYESVEGVNVIFRTAYPDFDRARLPVEQIEYRYAMENSGSLRWEYATRNYTMVIRQLFLHGRAFWNTIIFCSLSIIVALLVNPLAAYALSRFKLPGTYKVLLILMATMSFPPMVTMIPNFIILRELHLLNTFAAMILPGAANGYMIFLLKGFFDSLPEELYESATIDGASEIRMFFQITMLLSKPILAVVALGAFTGSYMQFLGLLIICPDEKMWTIMVWLYQYQNYMTMSGVYASILIAAVPTLLMFMIAQNIIMKGIVIPVEK